MGRTFWAWVRFIAGAYALLGVTVVSFGCGARTDARQSSYLEDPLGAGNGDPSSGKGANGEAARAEVTGFDKIDLLFVVDNSLGMADKHQVLAASMPQLLRRLTNPNCVDPSGNTVLVPPEPTLACPAGTTREFAPVTDLHIGIVTSSLGDFGGDTCPEEGVQNQATNDHAWLLGALPRARLSRLPFLTWHTDAPDFYERLLDTHIRRFDAALGDATELGCGNEMPLEALYRFLVDPKPPRDVIETNQAANHRDGIDNDVLLMRQAFLRPDSLVVAFILSDENDCSMRDDHYSWVLMTASNGFRMWRGSSVCAKNPNDPCCYSCMLDLFASEACKAKDTNCRQGAWEAKLSQPSDDINMRCRQMKRRFGVDLLFPPSRYVHALTLAELCPDQTYGDLDCNCTEAKKLGLSCDPKLATKVKNPLFQNLNPEVAPTGPVRPDAQAVLLTGVVGVPWQDLAVDYQAWPLQYRRASELDWELFAPRLDEDYSNAKLKDPLMVESSVPRSGTHPITGQAVAGPDSARMANAINGHEWLTSDKDVQFACTFNLEGMGLGGTDATHLCDREAVCGVPDGSDWYNVCARQFDACRCTLTAPDATTKTPLDPSVSRSPLCQDPWNQYGNRQYFAGAYPGLRELQVLRGFHEAHSGNSTIVGSICPKNANRAASDDPEFGYNPTMNRLVDELKLKLRKE